jgi:hypothetical protein
MSTIGKNNFPMRHLWLYCVSKMGELGSGIWGATGAAPRESDSPVSPRSDTDGASIQVYTSGRKFRFVSVVKPGRTSSYATKGGTPARLGYYDNYLRA